MISIVLPTYNGARYLRESVDSILHQTMPDWELIIVDDCSTDETPEIAEEYAGMDSRIRVLHNEANQRVPRSLNRGFQVARGEYLTWTSDDNRFLPTALEKMQDYLDQHLDVYLVCARVYVIGSDGKKNFSRVFPHAELPPFDASTFAYDDTLGACFLYRREVMEAVGGYDPSAYYVEDYEYWLRVYERFPHIGSIPEFLYEYRIHEGSLTSTQKKKCRTQLIKLRRKHLPFIFEQLKGNADYLTRLFLEMQFQGYLSQEEKEKFYPLISQWVEGLRPLSSDGMYIIYGAGDFGQQLYEKISSRVACFADQNPELQGQTIHNVPVFSVSEARKKFSSAKFVIAGDTNIAFRMIQTLQENKIDTYSYFMGIE